MAEAPTEKCLDDFFAKRDKKKKKTTEKGRGKEPASGPVVLAKKNKKEKSSKSESQDAQVEKVRPPTRNFPSNRPPLASSCTKTSFFRGDYSN